MSAADEAREKLEGVTPGPWLWDEDDEELKGLDRTVLSGVGYNDGTAGVFVGNEADAEFIAWCREGVPRLLAELDEIRALHNADGKRWVGLPRADKLVTYCTGCQEHAPCTHARILDRGQA